MNRELDAVVPASPLRLPVRQGLLFQKLRWRIFRNAGTLLFGNSRLRLVTMVLSSAVICALVFYASYEGFRLLGQTRLPRTGGIIGLLFDAMFFTLGGMLVFSTGLILYASLFTGAETRFLLTTPAYADQIFALKFQGAIGFSSWAFIILGGPILIAYGAVFGVPWYFYALLPVFFIGFVILPGAVGAMLCLLIVNFFPKKRKQALLSIILALLVLAGIWLYRVLIVARTTINTTRNRDALSGLFDMFALAQGDMSPGHWMSTGLLSMARGDLAGSLFPLAVLWSNALFFYVITAYLAKRLYRRGYNRMATGGDLRRRYGTVWLDRVMNFLVGYLDPKTRLLIVKDFRTFRREPAQVGQLFLFAFLLLLCVLNSRQFYEADIPVLHQHVVSLLNLCATGLLMCAYLARFIYPLISLEGRKFWVLGLLPLKREQLLWGKFAFAVTGTFVFGAGMVLLSDAVLGMPAAGMLLHLVAVCALVLGLSGLSVGLSAWMPNFRETDPSKIVVGFGGTINMVVSLLFLVLIVGVMALPYHFMVTAESFVQTGRGFPLWLFAGLGVGVVLTGLAVWLPMRLGIRTLRHMEF
jgi:ABC-2 type transport system permease protein